MKFRKLYWVTEQVASDGKSEVAAVFTSIQDLTDSGVHWIEDIDKKSAFRLTLVKLDSKQKPLGTWTSPDYPGIEDDLAEYVKTDEISSIQVEELVAKLRSLAVPV